MQINWKITGPAVREKAANACRLGALHLESTIRNTVNNGKRSGRAYRYGKGKKKRTHIASAPGEPPAKRTGNLINNANLRAEQVDDLCWNVILTAEYAKYLEYGTRRMAPRPFIKPSLEKTKKVISKMR